MSYNLINEKLNNGKLVILDGAMGSELEKSGAKMDKNLWCGTCSVEFPELVRKVHEDYIKAGADVITTNTYASTPISMKNYGLEGSIQRVELIKIWALFWLKIICAEFFTNMSLPAKLKSGYFS